MNSFSPSEIETINFSKECKRLIIGFGYLSMWMNHLKGGLGALLITAKVAFLFGVDDEVTIIIDNWRKIIRIGGNETESDRAREKNMGRRKVGWARSKCIGISEVPTDRDRESKDTKEGIFVQERDDTGSD
jgi:hypothetical protein